MGNIFQGWKLGEFGGPNFGKKHLTDTCQNVGAWLDALSRFPPPRDRELHNFSVVGDQQSSVVSGSMGAYEYTKSGQRGPLYCRYSQCRLARVFCDSRTVMRHCLMTWAKRRQTMNKIMRIFLLALAFPLGVAPNRGAQNTASKSVSDLIQRSHYIFLGRVEKTQSSTLKVLPASKRTAVVRVMKVLRSPRTLNNFTGQDITVVLAMSEGLKPGKELVFFTNGQLYGESIAVQEVGRLPNGREATRLKQQIRAADTRSSERELAARIAKAAIVVGGQVISSKPLVEGQSKPISEHDPQWQEAVIRVATVIKGKVPKSRLVAVLYPKSKDVMWAGAPQLAQGVSGIFILQRNQVEFGPPQLRVPGLTALHPLDLQPNAQLKLMRRLKAHP